MTFPVAPTLGILPKIRSSGPLDRPMEDSELVSSLEGGKLRAVRDR
jgi:hypothetical protein